MKKNILSLLLCLSATVVYAQTVERKNTMPEFFVPSGAFTTTPAPEKLPALPYNKNINPATKQSANKPAAQTKADKSTKSKPAAPAAAKVKTPDTNANAMIGPQLSVSQPVVTTKEPTTPDLAKPAPIIKTVPSWMKNTAKAPQKTTDLPAPVIKNNPPQPAPISTTKNEKKDNVSKIFAEYLHDRQAIGKGELYQNKHLDSILNDFQDVDRPL